MKEWEEVLLTDVATKIGDGLHGTPKYDIGGDYYFINGNNLVSGKVVIKEDTKRVNKSEYLKHSKPINERTLLLGINGTIGNVAYYKNEKCMLGKSACYINVNDETDLQFIYYTLVNKDFQNYIEGIATGTTILNVPLKGIREYTVKLPSLPEQRAIASILSSLDEKIDLLHRQNATLEKMAETLFRQWFIEEAKEEWGTGKLGDEFDLTMGASPPGESYNEEGFGIPMYQGNADFGFRFPTNRVFTTDPKRFAEKYDTLVSVRAPVGEQNMANERCCIGRGVAAFRFKKDNSFYTYTYYKMKSLMNDIKQFNETGTVFGSISKSDFENIEIVIPDKISIHKFQNEANPIDDKITTNTIQVRTLTALRDTLLPKLMSGKVRVEM